MVGNKIIAAIRSDGKVYPLDDDEGGGASGGSVLNSSHGQIANIFNLKLRVNSSASQNMSDSSDIIMNNNRIQASVMDLGKKLLQCARDNDINGVETMMRKGAPFASDWLGMTALHFGAMNDRYDICKLLLTSGGNKDARTKVDRTPLHLAAFYGHDRIAHLLIEFQCALNPRDMLRMTPLHWAVEKRHKSIVRLLLKHNADVTAISKFGKTPIALAVLTEQPDILQELETARQIQKSKKYNEQHEKETNEAVNSIIGGVKDDDEPVNKKSRLCSESEKLIKNNLGMSPDNFGDTTDAKDLDNSAINLLKSHGISMMKDDEDTSNNLLTTALQNGRQLVLSEGGKLLLDEAKRLGGENKIANNLKTPMSSQMNLVTQVKGKTEMDASSVQSVNRYRQNVISKQRDSAKKDVLSGSDSVTTNNNNEKQYKNIRIISLNDFKKMYGNGNMKTLQKIDASSNKSQIIKIKGDDKKIYMHKKSPEYNHIIHPDDLGIIEDDDDGELPPNIVKVSPESDQEDSSDIEAHQTAIIHPPTQQQTVEQRLLPVRHQSVTYSSRITYSRSPSVASVGEVKSERTPVIPLLTVPEICRQLLELRKQNDELRRKYEIAQKEKEDFRNRLEKLETFLLLEHTEEDYSEM